MKTTLEQIHFETRQACEQYLTGLLMLSEFQQRVYELQQKTPNLNGRTDPGTGLRYPY